MSFASRPFPRLDDAQMRRYSRQILLDAVGGRGQRALLAGAVAVPLDGDDETRAAALVALAYLAGAGVGTLALVGSWDAPVTEAELGLLLGDADLGAPRGPAIARRLAERTPDVRVVAAAALDGGAPPLRLDDGAPELGGALGASARQARALWRGGRAATQAIAALLEGR